MKRQTPDIVSSQIVAFGSEGPRASQEVSDNTGFSRMGEPGRPSRISGSGGSSPSFAESSSLPTIGLPKGGGAIRGIGEKFAASPATGAGAMSIPIPTSPGRSGFNPSLALGYDSSSGNGPFGFGWSLELPEISRKTAEGLPTYDDDEDIFILSGMEDLVPVLDAQAQRYCDRHSVEGVSIYRYRPRVESAFARIERWRDERTGDTHWRAISRNNVTTIYGQSPAERIIAPFSDDGEPRVFAWLITASFDDRGNAILYDYVAENDVGVDMGAMSEGNRDRGAQRYIKRIRYGNQTSSLLQPDLRRLDWHFELVFDYGDGHFVPIDQSGEGVSRDSTIRASAEGNGQWPARPDPFSTYRPGFELRMHRRCHRILMFHRFDELGSDPCLVVSTAFDFDDRRQAAFQDGVDERAHAGSTRYGSFLRRVVQSGHVRLADRGSEVRDGVRYQIYRRAANPPLVFEYSRAQIDTLVRRLDQDSLVNLPEGPDGGTYRFADLDGDGAPGILVQTAGAFHYKPNRGEGRFGALETLHVQPAIYTAAADAAQIVDLSGDGQLDLAEFTGDTPGFHERTSDRQWRRFRPFRKLPRIDWSDPNLRFVDLDGDGRADVLVTDLDAFTWYPSAGEEGFGRSRRVTPPWDEDASSRLVFADGEGTIHLADMSGDGLADLVRIRNGSVSYWPNLGHGRFGRRVDMDGAPVFDTPDLFAPDRVRLADIDGSGTNDILYIGRDGVRFYFNQCGNGFGGPERPDGFPTPHTMTNILVADVLGNGTACLVWSSPLPADAQAPMRYVDLMGGTKPHLLTRIVNNMGAETRVTYAPSTRFSLADQAAGRPWITRLPFPVFVVERVVTIDHISRNRFVSRYVYHHGYFDGQEREFRGFGMVEQIDTQEFTALSETGDLSIGANIDEASHVPPVLTKTWFHTGAWLDPSGVTDLYARGPDGLYTGEYFREPGRSLRQTRALLLADTVLPDGLTPAETREAARALRGAPLRTEIYALDGSAKAHMPYTVSENNYTLKLLQARGPNKHAVFFRHAREQLAYGYERSEVRVKNGAVLPPGSTDPEGLLRLDPRISHTLILEVDPHGTVLKAAKINYPRRYRDPDLSDWAQDSQAMTTVTLTESQVTNAVDTLNSHRTPQVWDTRGYELTGAAPTGPAGRYRTEDFVAPDPQLSGQMRFHGDRLLAYHDSPGSGRERRLLEHMVIFFRADDLSGPLPPGRLESLGIGWEAYTLAFTAEMIERTYGARVSDEMLISAGYVRLNGQAGQWWVPSGRLFYSPSSGDSPDAELAFANQHFFLPHRSRSPFHTEQSPMEALVTYDRYNLLALETQDALGNRTTVGERSIDPDAPLKQAGHDYRLLQPRLVMDPNRNRTAAAFDAQGALVATAVMGKPEDRPALGDRLEEGLITDPGAAEIAAIFDNPTGAEARALLGQATTRMVYDRFAFMRDGAPARAATILRENHLSEAEISKLQAGVVFSDGLGREIQRKSIAQSDETGRRWLTSGWVIYNNKGNPVRQYEPFFSRHPEFETDVRVGVSPIIHYDPVGREAAALLPDHLWRKVAFGPWHVASWTTADTADVVDPSSDQDVGDFFRRLPEGHYLPTWAGRRLAGDLGPQARQAAETVRMTRNTPSVTITDARGRAVLTREHNRTPGADGTLTDEVLESRTVFDIEGNTREIFDPLGRCVSRYDYDMLGNRIMRENMEGGIRLTLPDVTGQLSHSWDGRGHRIRNGYDRLHRPVATYLAVDGGPECLIGRSDFGENEPDPEIRNVRGRIVRVCDQSGVSTREAYDFKGNLVLESRRLAKEFRTLLDWSGDVDLEGETFVKRRRFDATNRTIQTVPFYSDQAPSTVSVLQPAYDEGGQLDRVDVWLDRTAEPDALLDPNLERPSTVGVSSLDYNARGQRLRIVYKNGVEKRFAYDDETFRLNRLETRHNGAGASAALQDLSYTYNPTGHIVHIRDQAQQDLFFRNIHVTADATFEYDAIGRLVAATGREHVGQNSGPPGPVLGAALPPTADHTALGRYRERFDYDPAGNLRRIRHIPAGNQSRGWTQHYVYREPSRLEADRFSNRLSETRIGQAISRISIDGDGYDTHGNMLRMDHLDALAWDFGDRLRMTRRQRTDLSGARTWYVYDYTGRRVRKITETAEGDIGNERIYLGGTELFRRHGSKALVRETLHVTDDAERIALIEIRRSGHEPDVPERLIRYQLSNHLGSSSVEIDESGGLISYEEYYPFGATALEVQRPHSGPRKRYRFTAMERDEESGLSHHGARYYASWLGRWTSADPAGVKDGMNLYAYARNAPISRVDVNGKQSGFWEEVENALDSITAGNYRRVKMKLNIDEIVAVKGNKAGGQAGSPSDPANKQFLDSRTNSQTKSNRVGPEPHRRPSTSMAQDPEGAANRALTSPLDEVDEIRAHADEATAATQAGRRTNSSLWTRIRNNPTVVSAFRAIGVDISTGTFNVPSSRPQFPKGESSVHLSPMDADLDPNTGRVVDGPNTRAASERYRRRSRGGGGGKPGGKRGRAGGLVGKVIAIGIAAYVLFDTGDVYAAAQTANPAAATTDNFVVEEDPSLGSTATAVATDLWNLTPMATVQWIMFDVLGPQGDNIYDQDLADRAVAEGRNPFCAQCHGPGGALDPNNEWNMQNRFGGMTFDNYEAPSLMTDDDLATMRELLMQTQ